MGAASTAPRRAHAQLCTHTSYNVAVAQSETLFEANDPVTNVYLVHTGKVCLLAPSVIALRSEHGVQVHHKLPAV